MMGVGILVAQFLRYQMKKSRRLTIVNVVERIRLRKRRFSWRGLSKRNVDLLVVDVFASMVGIMSAAMSNPEGGKWFLYFNAAMAMSLAGLVQQCVWKGESKVFRYCSGLTYFMGVVEGV
jgi:uncharacterized membrane protein